MAIKTFDPASSALSEAEHVFLGERRYTIQSVRGANHALIIALEGVATRSQAEALVGQQASVARAELSPPADGEMFQGDLIGLRAVDASGRELGKVEEVWNTGPVPNLVIRGGGQEWIVPFVDEFVPSVDLGEGRIVVKTPEWVE